MSVGRLWSRAMGRLEGAALSPQQSRCIELVGEGLTTKEIAFALGLSENTVDEHIKKAMVKLGAPNRMRAAAIHRAAQASTAAPMLTAPQNSAERGRQSDPVPYPQPGGVGISPVNENGIFEPRVATTMLLRDGGDARFGGFPPLQMPPRQPSEAEPERDAQSRLKVVSRVLTIAGAIALILVAAPALINGAEHIATWLRLTTHAQR